MLPLERINLIRELIIENRNMKISDLSKKLDVSEMTVHRDLKPLVEDGTVMKTFGGVTLTQSPVENNPNNQCTFCNGIIQKRLAYLLILPNNHTEMTCCAHCGLLRHQQLGDEVMQAICYDFFTSTTISAPLTWYVMDTTVDIGCCQPQVLTFEWEEHANHFVKGFGGKVFSFKDAIEAVSERMNDAGKHCH